MDTTTAMPRSDPAPAPDDTRPSAVAGELLGAITARDHATIRSLLAPNVWLRALLPRQVAEASTAEDAAELLEGWLGRPGDGALVDADHHTVHGREHLRYRLVVRPPWDRERWHELEQCGYVRVANGLVTRIDLVCTGYWPCDPPTGVSAPGAASPSTSRGRAASSR